MSDMGGLDFEGFREDIAKSDTFRYMGKIEKIVGMTIEASGPSCNIGDVCRIYSKDTINCRKFCLLEKIESSNTRTP